MHPHPVYIATGEIRELRALLIRRRLILTDRNRWQHRARSMLRGSGLRVRPGGHRLRAVLEELLNSPNGLDAYLSDSLDLCLRQLAALGVELQRVEAELPGRSRRIETIGRLQTLPGVGPLVPEVRQSGDVGRLGSITKMGAKALRGTLVQAAHVVISQCRTAEAVALQAIAERVRGSRGRRKIAVVALARHLLRIAYYILRDETTYEASRLEHGAYQDQALA